MEAAILELSFQDRLNQSQVYYAYNDNIDDREGTGKPTGKLFDINLTKNLCIIEFKFRNMSNDAKITKRLQYIKKLEEEHLKGIVAVITSSGDLQIYCNQDNFFMNSNKEVSNEYYYVYGHSTIPSPGEKL